MAKLLIHASKLKGEDLCLKSLTPSYRACSACDLFLKEDLFHIFMQCPAMDKIRRDMYSELSFYDNQIDEIFSDNPQEV